MTNALFAGASVRPTAPARTVHEASRPGAGMLAVLPHLGAIDEDLLDSGGQLLRFGEGCMVADIGRVEHHDIGIIAVAKHAAPLDAEVGRREGCQPADRFGEGEGFFVADAFWLPPDGNPVGPMALEVTVKPQRLRNPQITLVTVTQRASEEGERWKRYYEVIAPGWDRALRSLKRYLESG